MPPEETTEEPAVEYTYYYVMKDANITSTDHVFDEVIYSELKPLNKN